MQKILNKQIYFRKIPLYVLIIIFFGIILLKDYLGGNEPDVSVIEKYQNEVSTRAALLNKYKNIPEGFGYIYNILVPEVFCQNLVRIGNIEDGGKWVCNPSSIKQWSSECIIYSLGMNNDPSFEEDFQRFMGESKCKLRCVDKDDQTSQTMETIKNVNGIFKKGLIGAKRNESMKNVINLVDLVHEFDDEKIDILKIDIEGFEFEILHQILAIPVCQILIEIHSHTSNRTLNFLQNLSKHGYYLFSYEINGFFPHLCEYSFIHQNCFSEFNVNIIYGRYLS